MTGPFGGTWAIHDVRLAGREAGDPVDVLVAGDGVMDVGPGLAADVPDRVDGHGGLLLPAYVDTHIHLDKVLIRDQLAEHDGTLAGAIGSIHAAKRAYDVEDVRRRARSVIESSVLTGTTRLRSHVDVDTIGGLMPLQGVVAAARDCADIAEVQVIAFPQEGILRDPGAADLMAVAMRSGATVVGGMPHWERTEADQREHVRVCFDLAAAHDADVDMHVDETDDGSVRTLAMVVAETERRGWQGRVTVGHVCALAAADDGYADEVIAGCARAGITVVANPVTNLVLQGRGDRGLVRRGTTRIRELMAAGVPVAFGQDCVQDGFYPFGRGDLLEVALISAHAAHLTTLDEQLAALAAVTTTPARAFMGSGPAYGVVGGARADLQLYEAGSWPEVLRLQDPPRRVWHRGREVARTSVVRELLR
ncbi:MAG TPA: amidohydrolase family protein [Actinomycetes bacterium]|nr:amidohydrolase family protein [Actinomycetes bacterium]